MKKIFKGNTVLFSVTLVDKNTGKEIDLFKIDELKVVLLTAITRQPIAVKISGNNISARLDGLSCSTYGADISWKWIDSGIRSATGVRDFFQIVSDPRQADSVIPSEDSGIVVSTAFGADASFGVADYNYMINKPAINNKKLEGNVDSEKDLGITNLQVEKTDKEYPDVTIIINN